MKFLIIIMMAVFLLIPSTAFAQYMGNVGSGGETEPYTLEEELERQKQRITSAEANPAPGSQTLSTDKATLDVEISYGEIEPGIPTKINIDFINPQTQKIQEHIDYSIVILKEEQINFGPMSLTHTSIGSVKIPVDFNLGFGIYLIEIKVEGILFQPIPSEIVSFNIIVNDPTSKTKIPEWVKNIALWYGKGEISEEEFINAISFLIDEDILNVPQIQDLKIKNEFLESKISNLEEKIEGLERENSDETSQLPVTVLQISMDNDPIRGDPNAPITIIEFSDFQCPFCARFHVQTLPLLLDEYIDAGKVNLVYRDFPIQSIHPNAQPAAIAAECAHEQGKYWEYHDTLFEKQNDWHKRNSEEAISFFIQYAVDVDLEQQQFDSCLESKKYLKEVQGDLSDGRDYDITGTPAFFIGNNEIGFVKLTGAQPFEVFKNVIDSLIEKL